MRENPTTSAFSKMLDLEMLDLKMSDVAERKQSSIALRKLLATRAKTILPNALSWRVRKHRSTLLYQHASPSSKLQHFLLDNLLVGKICRGICGQEDREQRLPVVVVLPAVKLPDVLECVG